MDNLYVNDFTTTVKTYYEELKLCKPLTKAKERELMFKAKNGDIEAKNMILESNLRLVFDIAKRYRGRGVALPDLISEGNMGLIKAMDKFKPNMNVRFMSYAVWWVRNSMSECIKNKMVISAIEKGEDDLNNAVLEKAPYDEEDERLTKGETLYQPDDDNDDDSTVSDKKKVVNELLSKLDEREKYIMVHYYGIGGEMEMNLEEIGNNLNITKERVRQIKSKIFEKLRTDILLMESADFLFG